MRQRLHTQDEKDHLNGDDDRDTEKTHATFLNSGDERDTWKYIENT